jgi:hypothetical protein
LTMRRFSVEAKGKGSQNAVLCYYNAVLCYYDVVYRIRILVQIA